MAKVTVVFDYYEALLVQQELKIPIVGGEEDPILESIRCGAILAVDTALDSWEEPEEDSK